MIPVVWLFIPVRKFYNHNIQQEQITRWHKMTDGVPVEENILALMLSDSVLSQSVLHLCLYHPHCAHALCLILIT